jgi:hypothetical protein
MRKTVALLLVLILCPTIVYADRSHGHRPGPPPPYGGPHSGPYPYHSGHGHHDDEWIVPLAIVGSLFGIMALSRMTTPPPPPPRRICRDTYNYYDEYGNYLYSRYVDRPCEY